MRIEKSLRYIGLSAPNAEGLGEKLTEMSNRYSQYDPKVVWNLGNGCSAFLVFEEIERFPEDIREEYEMRGDYYTCGDCPYKEAVTDGRSHYPYKCHRMPRGTEDRQRACIFFYEMLEKGAMK